MRTFAIVSISVLVLGCAHIRPKKQQYKSLKSVRVCVPYLKSEIYDTLSMYQRECFISNPQIILISTNMDDSLMFFVDKYAIIDIYKTMIDSVYLKQQINNLSAPYDIHPIIYNKCKIETYDSIQFFTFLCDIEYLKTSGPSNSIHNQTDFYCFGDHLNHDFSIFSFPSKVSLSKKMEYIEIKRITILK
ncbi:MAG: hypothetical protein IT244_03755 [Bacteroidia bacterium]|nr:hypothetical protein [Bacteroidia bacterium]